MSEDRKTIIGERLKKLRYSKNRSVIDILEHLDCARSTYTGYEMGRRGPDSNTLVKLAEFFNTTTDYILGYTDDDSPLSEKENEIRELIKGKKLTWEGKEITEDQAFAISEIIEAYLRTQKNNKQS
mgnify:CR=1 FL=1